MVCVASQIAFRCMRSLRDMFDKDEGVVTLTTNTWNAYFDGKARKPGPASCLLEAVERIGCTAERDFIMVDQWGLRHDILNDNIVQLKLCVQRQMAHQAIARSRSDFASKKDVWPDVEVTNRSSKDLCAQEQALLDQVITGAMTTQVHLAKQHSCPISTAKCKKCGLIDIVEHRHFCCKDSEEVRKNFSDVMDAYEANGFNASMINHGILPHSECYKQWMRFLHNVQVCCAVSNADGEFFSDGSLHCGADVCWKHGGFAIVQNGEPVIANILPGSVQGIDRAELLCAVVLSEAPGRTSLGSDSQYIVDVVNIIKSKLSELVQWICSNPRLGCTRGIESVAGLLPRPTLAMRTF